MSQLFASGGQSIGIIIFTINMNKGIQLMNLSLKEILMELNTASIVKGKMEIKSRMIERLHFRYHFSDKEPFPKDVTFWWEGCPEEWATLTLNGALSRALCFLLVLVRAAKTECRKRGTSQRWLPPSSGGAVRACVSAGARRPLRRGIRSGSADPGLPGLRRSSGGILPCACRFCVPGFTFYKNPGCIGLGLL